MKYQQRRDGPASDNNNNNQTRSNGFLSGDSRGFGNNRKQLTGPAAFSRNLPARAAVPRPVQTCSLKAEAGCFDVATLLLPAKTKGDASGSWCVSNFKAHNVTNTTVATTSVTPLETDTIATTSSWSATSNASSRFDRSHDYENYGLENSVNHHHRNAAISFRGTVCDDHPSIGVNSPQLSLISTKMPGYDQHFPAPAMTFRKADNPPHHAGMKPSSAPVASRTPTKHDQSTLTPNSFDGGNSRRGRHEEIHNPSQCHDNYHGDESDNSDDGEEVASSSNYSSCFLPKNDAIELEKISKSNCAKLCQSDNSIASPTQAAASQAVISANYRAPPHVFQTPNPEDACDEREKEHRRRLLAIEQQQMILQQVEAARASRATKSGRQQQFVLQKNSSLKPTVMSTDKDFSTDEKLEPCNHDDVTSTEDNVSSHTPAVDDCPEPRTRSTFKVPEKKPRAPRTQGRLFTRLSDGKIVETKLSSPSTTSIVSINNRTKLADPATNNEKGVVKENGEHEKKWGRGGQGRRPKKNQVAHA